MNRLSRLLLVMILLVTGAGAALAQTPSLTPDPCDLSPDAEYFVGQGNAFFAAEDYTRAIASYTCAVEHDSNYAPAYSARGYARSVQGDEPGAMTDFDRAIELDENQIEAYINRGALYLRQGNIAVALGDLTIALALDPANVRALQNRAVVYASEGSYELAMDDLNAALSIAPDDPELHATLGAVYLALAAQSYGQFRALAGESIPITGGAPTSMYLAMERNIVTGSFGEWLAFLRSAE